MQVGRRRSSEKASIDSDAITENTASITGSVRPGTVGQDSDPDNTNAELTVTAIRTGTEAGSGTTGAVAASLGRRFVLVDENPDALATMRARLGEGVVFE